MKRPQGYDQRAPGDESTSAPKSTARRTPAAKPSAAKPPAAKPSGAKPPRSRPGAGPASDHTTTEPISLPVTPIAPVSPLRRSAGTGSASPIDAAAAESAASDPAVPGQAEAPGDVPLTPAGARRKFRAARRARKLYEREEVRRFTWRSRRRRNIWLAALGTLAALVGFVLVGTFSPLMALRTVEVVGANRIPAEQIQTALEGQLGTPLPLVDFAEVKRELSAFTLIQSYVTESRPPNTLVVRIVEREPIGALVTQTGFDLVDAAGVVIQSTAERPAGYATIDARSGKGSAGFRAATAVIAALPAEIRASLDTVTAATKDDVTLTLAGGARVVWGSAEKSDFKAVVLAALIVSNPVGTVGEYDVSSPDSAVLR